MLVDDTGFKGRGRGVSFTAGDSARSVIVNLFNNSRIASWTRRNGSRTVQLSD